MSTRRDRIEALAKAIALQEAQLPTLKQSWDLYQPKTHQLFRDEAADLLKCMTRAGLKLRLRGEK